MIASPRRALVGRLEHDRHLSSPAMTLKICHLISGDLWAGAEVMAFQLLNGLRAIPGIDLFVIVSNRGRLSNQLENVGIPICVLDEDKRSFPEIVVSAAKMIRRRAPHILHSHRYKENLLSYLVSITLKENAALVSTQHGMPELYGGRSSLLHRLKSYANYRLLASKFDRTVAVSTDIKESLARDYGFTDRHLETIRNGIVVPEAPSCSREKEGFVIGSAGRFFPVKDYPFMVEVAKEVVTKTGKIRFELAGEGPMLGDIQGLIRKYGLEDAFMLRGFIRNVGAFYQGLDVYLNTSLHEGIPMSVLEAMAHGVPPIVPRVGGLEEIVADGVDGYLVDGRHPRDFADRCFSLYKNESLRRNMGLAAREKVIRQFSIKRMVDAYLEMYMRAIEIGGQGKRRRFYWTSKS